MRRIRSDSPFATALILLAGIDDDGVTLRNWVGSTSGLTPVSPDVISVETIQWNGSPLFAFFNTSRLATRINLAGFSGFIPVNPFVFALVYNQNGTLPANAGLIDGGASGIGLRSSSSGGHLKLVGNSTDVIQSNAAPGNGATYLIAFDTSNGGVANSYYTLAGGTINAPENTVADSTNFVGATPFRLDYVTGQPGFPGEIILIGIGSGDSYQPTIADWKSLALDPYGTLFVISPLNTATSRLSNGNLNTHTIRGAATNSAALAIAQADAVTALTSKFKSKSNGSLTIAQANTACALTATFRSKSVGSLNVVGQNAVCALTAHFGTGRNAVLNVQGGNAVVALTATNVIQRNLWTESIRTSAGGSLKTRVIRGLSSTINASLAIAQQDAVCTILGSVHNPTRNSQLAMPVDVTGAMIGTGIASNGFNASLTIQQADAVCALTAHSTAPNIFNGSFLINGQDAIVALTATAKSQSRGSLAITMQDAVAALTATSKTKINGSIFIAQQDTVVALTAVNIVPQRNAVLAITQANTAVALTATSKPTFNARLNVVGADAVCALVGHTNPVGHHDAAFSITMQDTSVALTAQFIPKRSAAFQIFQDDTKVALTATYRVASVSAQFSITQDDAVAALQARLSIAGECALDDFSSWDVEVDLL